MIRGTLQTFRSLVRSPVFAASVVLSVALGLGLNITLLSLVRGVLVRPLGVPDSERLVSLYLSDARSPRTGPFPYPLYELLRDSAGPAANVFGFLEFQEPVIINGSAELLRGEFITPNYFELLGVRTTLGRTITPSDDRSSGSRRVVVVSERFWHARLGGTVDSIGRPILLNSQELRVIGVVPSTFRGMNLPSIAPTDAWVLFSEAHEVTPVVPRDLLTAFDRLTLRLRVRLPNDSGSEGVERQVNEIVSRLGVEHRSLRDKVAVVRRTDQEMLFPGADSAAKSIVATMLGLGILVLLVICANLIHLLLARSVDRLPEIATRRLLGAGRLRAAATTLGETGSLVSLGFVSSIAIARVFSALLARSATSYGASYALFFEPLIDWLVYAVTFLATITLGLISVAGPALLATRHSVVYSVLGQRWTSATGRWSRRFRTGLVAGQVTVAVALLVIAVTFFRAAHEAATRNIGLASDAALIGFDARRAEAYKETAQLTGLHREMVRTVRALPMVERSTLVDFLPIGTRRDSARIIIDAASARAQQVEVDIQRVGPEYFEIVKTPIIAGRGFNQTDVAGQPMTAVISETAAREIWNRPVPIGERFTMSIKNARFTMTVVGVAKDTDVRFIGERHWALVYLPFWQHPSQEFHVMADTSSSGRAMSSVISNKLRTIDPTVPVVRVSTVDEWVETWIYPYRLVALFMGAFALTAALVSAVGVFGLAHYWTSTRTQEFGLRQALGAAPRAILILVMRQHLVPLVASTGLGLAIGGLAVVAFSRVLFRMVSFDASVIAIVAVTVLGLAATAIYLPASRAVSLEPSEALRRL